MKSALCLSTSRLLVSVRDLREATLAADAGIDLIDFKEPSQGALAACDPKRWAEAADQFASSIRAGKVELSAALGESDTGVSLSSLVPHSFSFAKVGPSHCATPDQLKRVWDAVELPASVELVPVAYADHVAANSIDVFAVLDAVCQTGRRRLLVDTFTKDGRSLTDHCDVESLRRLLAFATAAGVWIALAGSVRMQAMQALQSAGVRPQCWGVRGDVCGGHDRTGPIDPQRVAEWRSALPASRQP